MDTQTTLQVRFEKELDLSDEELDCAKYMLGEYKKWKRLKNAEP
ncbi:MAG: hypothetical protein ABIH20_02745 [Candidatus Diapherotrites archaeon]